MALQLAGQFSTLDVSKKAKTKQAEFSAPSQMVTFIIKEGEMKETFIVHKEHACKYSPVLEKAFNSQFKEGRTQVYVMEDTLPDTFRIFVHWLYSQKLTHIHYEEYYDSNIEDEDGQIYANKCSLETQTRIKLWVLAEKLLVPRLQNEVMELLGLISQTCTTPFEICVEYIYANTADSSPLRLFVVNLIAWTAPSREYKKYPHLYPYGFLLDLATVFSAAVPRRAAANKRDRLDITDYYIEDSAS